MADQKKTARATVYVVFKKNSTNAWVRIGSPVEAANGEAAIKKIAKDAGAYAACPERSWTEPEPLALVPQPAKLVFGGQGEQQEMLPVDGTLADALEEVDAEVERHSIRA